MQQTYVCAEQYLIDEFGPLSVSLVARVSRRQRREWFETLTTEATDKMLLCLIGEWQMVDAAGAACAPFAGPGGDVKIFDELDVVVYRWVTFAVSEMLNDRQMLPFKSASVLPASP